MQAAGFCHATAPLVASVLALSCMVIAITEDCLKNVQGEAIKWKIPDKSMIRHFCPTCGRLLWNTNKFPGFIAIGIETLRKDGLVDEAVEPKLRLNYAERIVDAADDLPKFLNFPEPLGGDGVLFEETTEERVL